MPDRRSPPLALRVPSSSRAVPRPRGTSWCTTSVHRVRCSLRRSARSSATMASSWRAFDHDPVGDLARRERGDQRRAARSRALRRARTKLAPFAPTAPDRAPHRLAAALVADHRGLGFRRRSPVTFASSAARSPTISTSAIHPSRQRAVLELARARHRDDDPIARSDRTPHRPCPRAASPRRTDRTSWSPCPGRGADATAWARARRHGRARPAGRERQLAATAAITEAAGDPPLIEERDRAGGLSLVIEREPAVRAAARSGSSTSVKVAAATVAPTATAALTSGRRAADDVIRPRTAVSIIVALTSGSSTIVCAPSANAPGVISCIAFVLAPRDDPPSELLVVDIAYPAPLDLADDSAACRSTPRAWHACESRRTLLLEIHARRDRPHVDVVDIDQRARRRRSGSSRAFRCA